MSAATIAHALGGARREGCGWRCKCPLHGGRSLALRDGNSGLLVWCFGGCDSRDVLAELRRAGLMEGRPIDPDLRSYAAHCFAFCATWNRRYLRPMRRVHGAARPVWLQLLMATELFVIAHEYAHHIEQHRVGDSVGVDGASSELRKVQELRADQLAALITAHFGAENSNSFAQSGSSAVLALIGTDMVRRTRSVLETGDVEERFVSDTHPPLGDRLQVLDTLRYDPRNADAVR